METEPTLLFDDGCPICTAAAGRLRRITGERVRIEPLSSALRLHPHIDEAEALREIKLVQDDRTWGGVEAILRALATARWPWRVVLAAYLLPGIRQVADAAYAAFARRRRRVEAGSG